MAGGRASWSVRGPINPHFRDGLCNIINSCRSCGGLKRIYLLIRPKKGKDPQERIKDIFQNVVSRVGIMETMRIHCLAYEINQITCGVWCVVYV